MRPLGILMLDTRFPRIEGDVGNPASLPFPVIFERLDGVGPADAVAPVPDRERILDRLRQSAERLAARGAVGIGTSCGFLALFQAELAAVSPIPVATSALLLVAQLARTLPGGKRIGVITASAASLTPAHLASAGADPGTPVVGMPPHGAFAHTFLGNAADLDRQAVERETLESGRRLLAACPELGGIVLECTNLPPYAAALRRTFGLPVYDVLDMLRLFRSGLPA
jgi:hypothetical protein